MKSNCLKPEFLRMILPSMNYDDSTVSKKGVRQTVKNDSE